MKKIILLACLMILAIGNADAQGLSSTGMSFTISKAVKLSLDGNAVSNNEGVTASANETNNEIAVQLNFSNLKPAANSTEANNVYYIKVPIRIRSNASYELYVSQNAPVSDVLDIGFGVAKVSRPSNNLTFPGNDIAAGYESEAIANTAFDKQNSVSESGGIPFYGWDVNKNIAEVTNSSAADYNSYLVNDNRFENYAGYSENHSDISTASNARILSGPRISRGGDNSSKNYLSAEVLLAVRLKNNAANSSAIETINIAVR